MEDKAVISIIIPCFNGYKYMKKCFFSFEKQTRKDFKLIIVDDASLDDSFEKLKKYAKESKMKISIIHNEKNMGPGVSRKIALEECDTKYVGFCDCDDWVDTRYIEEVIQLIEQQQADLCMYNNYRVNNDKQRVDDVITPLQTAKNKNEILAYAPMSLCRVVAKKDLINGVKFYDMYYGEDGIVLMQMLINARHPIYTSKPYYYYLMRNNSAHARPSKRCFDDAVKGYEYLKENMPEEFHEEIVFTGIKNLIYGGTLQAFKAGIDDDIIKNAINNFKDENPDYIKNKYINTLNKLKVVYIWMVYNNMLWCAKMLSYIHTYIMGR